MGKTNFSDDFKRDAVAQERGQGDVDNGITIRTI